MKPRAKAERTGHRSILRAGRSLWSDRAAGSAVEFALVLPILLSMLLGGFELSRLQAVSRKVTLTTRAVADLTTQNAILSTSDLNVILGASSQIFSPFSTSGLKVVVSELAISAAGVATVDWSQSLNTPALPQGQVEVVPAGLAQPNTWLIWCKITYSYTPLVTTVFGTTRTLSDQIYMSPRLSNSIALNG